MLICIDYHAVAARQRNRRVPKLYIAYCMQPKKGRHYLGEMFSSEHMEQTCNAFNAWIHVSLKYCQLYGKFVVNYKLTSVAVITAGPRGGR